MGRPQTDSQHLLDTSAEQNIGNSTLLQPQDGSATIIPQTNPARLLQLNGPSKRGQLTSIVLTASRIVGADNPRPGLAGPVTGIIEFGNGGRSTKVEVDIPLGPYQGVFQAVASATEPQDGGVIVSVPTGVLRAYVRYDNRLIQPLLGTTALSLAQIQGAPFQGPGGPVGYPVAGGLVYPEPVLAKAMAAYFSRHWARAHKTQYLYVGSFGSMGQIPIIVSGTPIPSPNPVPINPSPALYCIPAFARSVQILRNPASAAMTVKLYDGIWQLNTIDVPAGASPIIPIVGTETVIGIQSATLNDIVNILALSYEIGV
jgi:hypothetical protein